MQQDRRETAKKLFTILVDDTNGFEISMHARKKHALTSKELTYGEVMFDSFWDILDIVKPQPGEIFYDLGCGVGKPVFIAALYGAFSKAVGVELLPEVYNQAVALKAAFEKIVSHTGQVGSEVAFLHEDIFKVTFADADVVFLPSTCFDDDMMARFAETCASLKPGTRIITLTKQLKRDDVQLVHRKLYAMTWGDTTVHIYQKEEA